MGKSSGFSSFFFLQISLGIYFGVMGINGLATYSSRGAQIMRLFNNDILNLIIAIVLLLAGIFLVASLFAPIGGNFAGIIYIAVIVIWAIVIVLSLIVNNLFKPSFLGWLAELAWRVAILSGTWIVSRKDM